MMVVTLATSRLSAVFSSIIDMTRLPIVSFKFHTYAQTTHRHLPLYVHTLTRLTALFPGLPGWAGTRKVKPIWILLKQETVSGSDISWNIRKSAPSSRQITTPASHRSVFLQAGCPSCRPTNSVEAPKASFHRGAILCKSRTRRELTQHPSRQ